MDVLSTQTILLSFVIVALFIGLIVYNFSTELATLAMFQGAALQEVVQEGQTLTSKLDWVYPTVFFVLMLFSMIAAHKIPSDSVYFIWALILSPIITFIIGLMGFILKAIFSQSAFNPVTSQMPITSFMVTPPVPMITAILYQLMVIILLYAGKNE